MHRSESIPRRIHLKNNFSPREAGLNVTSDRFYSTLREVSISLPALTAFFSPFRGLIYTSSGLKDGTYLAVRDLMGVISSNVLGLILGGGRGERLFPLTKHRSKPAVPMAGKYCIVDIPSQQLHQFRHSQSICHDPIQFRFSQPTYCSDVPF